MFFRYRTCRLNRCTFLIFLFVVRLLWRAFSVIRRALFRRMSESLNAQICIATLLAYYLANLTLLTVHKNPQHHFVLLSATFYTFSSIYEPNTAILLLNGPRTIRTAVRSLTCITANGTHKRTKRIALRFAYPPVDVCQWTAFIATCPAVENLSKIFLTDSFSLKLNVEIPFRSPFTGRRMEVVTCFSPLFYMEHWQMLFTSLEIYKYFGVQLQIIYIQSILVEIMDVLKIYHRKGYLEMEPWSSIKFDLKSQFELGYDPNVELDWRNQASAHTDCLLKYREATEFIIIGDIDDILIPMAKTYNDEFRILFSSHFNAAAFIYRRFNTEVQSNARPEYYSLNYVLQSANISDRQETGKYALRTSQVETAWLHWPGIMLGRLHSVPMDFNIMLHLRNWTLFESMPPPIGLKEKQEKQSMQLTDANLNTNIKWSFLRKFSSGKGLRKRYPQLKAPDFLLSIEAEFNRMRVSHAETFHRLPSKQIYLPLIVDCYDRIFYSRNKRPNSCPGPVKCRQPEIDGLRCAVANAGILASHKLPWWLVLHTHKSPPRFELRENGCSMS